MTRRHLLAWDGTLLHRMSAPVEISRMEIADRICTGFGLTRADCVAYGGSLSDAEPFGTVPASAAVNTDWHLAELATHSCTGQDLWDAYGLVRRVR